MRLCRCEVLYQPRHLSKPIQDIWPEAWPRAVALIRLQTLDWLLQTQTLAVFTFLLCKPISPQILTPYLPHSKISHHLVNIIKKVPLNIIDNMRLPPGPELFFPILKASLVSDWFMFQGAMNLKLFPNFYSCRKPGEMNEVIWLLISKDNPEQSCKNSRRAELGENKCRQ